MNKKQSVTPEDKILTQLFESEDGKRALKYLKAIFYDNSTFVQGDSNSNFIMYKIGQQDVIGFILETIEVVNQTSNIKVVRG